MKVGLWRNRISRIFDALILVLEDWECHGQLKKKTNPMNQQMNQQFSCKAQMTSLKLLYSGYNLIQRPSCIEKALMLGKFEGKTEGLLYLDIDCCPPGPKCFYQFTCETMSRQVLFFLQMLWQKGVRIYWWLFEKIKKVKLTRLCYLLLPGLHATKMYKRVITKC